MRLRRQLGRTVAEAKDEDGEEPLRDGDVLMLSPRAYNRYMERSGRGYTAETEHNVVRGFVRSLGGS